MKVAMKLGMLSATHLSVTVPVGGVRKIWTALRANQIVGFITVPSEKKINFDISDYSSAITITTLWIKCTKNAKNSFLDLFSGCLILIT